MPDAPLPTAGNPGAEATRARFQRYREAIVEDVEMLIDTETPEGVSRRLGYTNPRSLSRALYRAGRPDLARRFDDWALRRKEAA